MLEHLSRNTDVSPVTLVPCRLPQKEEETVVIIQQDPQLEEALQQSRRVGDLLLKNEEQETAEINRLAADLLDREYRCTLVACCCLSGEEVKPHSSVVLLQQSQ